MYRCFEFQLIKREVTGLNNLIADKLNIFCFPQEIPGTVQLASILRQTWKPSDLQRMELVIAKKLDWNIMQPTSLAFIHLFSEILSSRTSSTDVSLSSLSLSIYEVCINFNMYTAYNVSKDEKLDQNLFKLKSVWVTLTPENV